MAQFNVKKLLGKVNINEIRLFLDKEALRKENTNENRVVSELLEIYVLGTLGTPVCTKSLQSCPTLCYAMGWGQLRLLPPWDSPGKNTGVGYHALLQGIFPIQGSNLHLLHLQHQQVSSLPVPLPAKL